MACWLEGPRRMNPTHSKRKAFETCKEQGHEWKDWGTYSMCERCGKKKRNPSPVSVKRVVPETGEIIEQTVSPNYFRPKAPDYLTSKFRERVLAGERPGLVLPGDNDCPLEVGQEVSLTPNVAIAINRITKTKGGDHRCHYTVIDMRATLPRRTPPMFEPPETDELGYPIKPTPGAIAAATIDGNYCQGSGQAVPDVGEEVDVEYRRVLGVKKRKADMENEASEDARRKRERAIRDDLRATLKGLEAQAAVELLAGIERLCREAKDSSAAVV